jgi:4-oxalocrotonate tautomerase
MIDSRARPPSLSTSAWRRRITKNERTHCWIGGVIDRHLTETEYHQSAESSTIDLQKKEAIMPYVNIRITKEGATPEQKARLIQGVTQLLVDVLGKNPQTTFVIIDEVDTDNWGVAGESITVRRRKSDK